MRKVVLKMKEQNKFETIKNLVEKGGNKKRAALKLGITIRQLDRLIKVYGKKGKAGFIHGNRSKIPANKTNSSVSATIIHLYQTTYQGFNIKHFHEYLESNENIKVSYTFLYNLVKNNNLLSPKAHRKTRKNMSKKIKLQNKKFKDTSKEELDLIIDYEISLEDAHPRQPKPKNFGEVIEQDGSIHNWFGTNKACLHLACDKATNTIVGAFFDKQETLFGYYSVFKQILENYGIPFSFLTDNRTVFNYERINPSERTSDRDVLTQFGYACKKLGVDLSTTSVPQAKGLIERNNGTFQDRLVNELRLNNITTISKANVYLINIFVPAFNKKFSKLLKNKNNNVFSQSPTNEEINYTLAILEPRTIDNGNSIKYHNNYYQPYSNNSLVCIKPKTKCLVIKAFDNTLLASIGEKIYELKKLEKNSSVSKNFDTEDIKIVYPKKKMPQMQTNWKLEEFMKQLANVSKNRVYSG